MTKEHKKAISNKIAMLNLDCDISMLRDDTIVLYLNTRYYTYSHVMLKSQCVLSSINSIREIKSSNCIINNENKELKIKIYF